MKNIFNTIVSIIAGALIYSTYTNYSAGLHDGCQKCMASQLELLNISEELKSIKRETGDFPVSLDAIALHPSATIDSWNRTYLYLMSRSGDEECLVIGTLGSDGLSGGEERAEDDIFLSVGCTNLKRVFWDTKESNGKLAKPELSDVIRELEL